MFKFAPGKLVFGLPALTPSGPHCVHSKLFQTILSNWILIQVLLTPIFLEWGKHPIPKKMAENEGFEPSEPYGSTVFKTAAFDHSANSPDNLQLHSQITTLGRAYLTGFRACFNEYMATFDFIISKTLFKTENRLEILH